MPLINNGINYLENTEFHIYNISADLVLETGSYLDVLDQMNMKGVCKWWRINLSETLLSRLVDMDASRIENQAETYLEHQLNKHVRKNTKVLVIRRMAFKKNEFGIVARVIKQKCAALIQLTLKSCEVHKEMAAAAYWWTHPEDISPRLRPSMMHSIIFATRKLVLEDYTSRDGLSGVLGWFGPSMPCDTRDESRDNFFKPLPVCLPWHEFDCTQPVAQLYYSFVMALNSNCPEVCPEIRNKVVLLYNSWIHCDTEEKHWRELDWLLKCLNDGVAITFEDYDVDVSALRQLDPLTLNKLTIYALYRLYF